MNGSLSINATLYSLRSHRKADSQFGSNIPHSELLFISVLCGQRISHIMSIAIIHV